MNKKILRLLLGTGVFIFLLTPHLSISSTETVLPNLNFDFDAFLRKPRIALTFDDGPHAYYTEEILRILRDEGARATFFVVGKQVKIYPELLQKIDLSGNEIENHTYNHFNLTRLNNLQVESEIKMNEDLISQVIGKKPQYFRPPGGHFNREVVEVGKDNGEDMALWSISGNDTDRPHPDYIYQRILNNVENKSIILLHSGVKETIEALPGLIRELKNRGYRLVTLTELDEAGASS